MRLIRPGRRPATAGERVAMATTRKRSTKTPTPAKRRPEAAAATTPSAPRRSRRRAAPTGARHEDIAVRAFLIAQAEGGGDPVAHWLRAERELTAG
jgi:hypothetical protein